MRTLYALGVALLAAPTYGQLMRPAFEAHPEGKHHGGYAVPGHQLGSAKGTTYFSEPFDAGLNGWTVNTPSGVDWAWTDVGPGPTTSTYPVPPLNSSSPSGWVIVDDDFLGQGLTTETSLISPVIDLSMAPQFLKLEFEQYFQEWQEDHCYVGVSTDGGVTWDETEIGEGVGRDGRPNPELVDLDISSWVANDPANVQLRFRYTSIWDYGWQIDN
ncbi:MAG: hypothetical protein KDB88_00690, partial [Flavobacteriales bacterium]|nr:hypothetical protein [Flavobacteriales bacterium]